MTLSEEQWVRTHVSEQSGLAPGYVLVSSTMHREQGSLGISVSMQQFAGRSTTFDQP